MDFLSYCVPQLLWHKETQTCLCKSLFVGISLYNVYDDIDQ